MEIPEPKVGLVISYAYLWRREADTGAVEGRKDRPCAIILAMRSDTASGELKIVVAPITHQRPIDQDIAIEIPLGVKRHLGLDDVPAWIVLEVNRFTWPGPDLRPISRDQPDRCAYGMLPPKLMLQIKRRFAQLATERRVKLSDRPD